MNKHSFAIFLFLLCLLVSSPAEARLTLGVVAGPDSASGDVSSVQVSSFAARLAEGLQEEVVVKELADSDTLINWLDRFAMLDLALLSSEEVNANPGRFLSLGQIDGGPLTLVSRQGIGGDLPQRAAKILSGSGFTTTEKAEGVDAEAPSVMEERPPRTKSDLEEAVVSQKELEHVPPLSPGRAWTPQEDGAYRDLLPSDEPALTKLVLGVAPDPRGLLHTAEQAQQFAVYLEQTLPVSVKIREFASMESFSEWFMRYKMVDLAILTPSFAEANLGRDYQPLVKILRSDKLGEESAELVIVRRGQNQELIAPIRSALLDATQASDGRAFLTALNISEVLALELPARLPAVVEETPEPVQKVSPPTPIWPEEVVEEQQPTEPDYADPVEPVAPPEITVQSLPGLPHPGGPAVVPPMTVASAIVPALPGQKTAPEQPEELEVDTEIEIPAIAPQTLEPVDPSVPQTPSLVVVTAPPEMVAVVEPPVVPETPLEAPVEAPVVPESTEPPALELKEMTPAQVPEEPGASPLPQLEVVVEPVEVAETLEMPVVPVAPIAPEITTPPLPELELVPAPAPEEAVLTAVPQIEDVDEPVEVVEAPGESSEPAEQPIEDSAASVSMEEVEPILSDTLTIEEQRMIEEAKLFAKLISAPRHTEQQESSTEENQEALLDAELIALLGEDSVAAMVAQPDIPQEFRPSGVPVVRVPRASGRPPTEVDEQIVASMPEPLRQTVPAQPPQLLPQPEPEPGVIYVVPFAAIMVPHDVNARIFDQFVDHLNQGGEDLGLQFVILKEGLQRVDPTWLQIRKYVTGEIYAYVEDSGCCSTDLRTKARLTYRRPSQSAPAFGYEYPVKRFFDHDLSTIDVERAKLADDIAATLANELLASLRN